MKLDEISFIKEIGHGSVSVVWRAKHDPSGKLYAVKVIDYSSVTNPKSMEHLENECACLQTLASENVPGVYRLEAVLKDEIATYLVLDLVDGTPLHIHIRIANGLNLDLAREYVSQLVVILECLHDRGFIYRDLKASNVLVLTNQPKCIKLIDFGFAKNLGSRRGRTSSYCGTLHAMSPEVQRTAQNSELLYDYGFAVDWWSLGILLYEIIYNAVPFGYNDSR